MKPSPALLQKLGIDTLSPEEQEQMLLELADMVFQGALVRIIEKMDDATREDFALVCEKDTDGEAVKQFLAERVPEADALMQEALDALTKDAALFAIPAETPKD